MKALAKTKPEKGVELIDTDMPQVGPNDVLIKINKTAICGTDLHIYEWDEWAKHHIKPPLIIGHEFTGQIIELGQEVKTYFKLGDRVAGEGHIACGHCRNCRAARAHLCRKNISVGVSRTGAFAEYIAIPAVNAYPIPNDISDTHAAILDPLGNATHTALTYDVIGEDVLITGAGPVGLMATSVARHVGARYIVVTDVNPYRLALAKKMGATAAINPTVTTLLDIMKQLGMREGFDVGMEMSGNPDALHDMLKHINHAGKIALLGFQPESTNLDWTNLIMKGITIKGIYGREMYDTWYKMITMLQSGLDISPVITHEFYYTDFQNAFNTLQSGNAAKIVLNWEKHRPSA